MLHSDSLHELERRHPESRLHATREGSRRSRRGVGDLGKTELSIEVRDDETLDPAKRGVLRTQVLEDHVSRLRRARIEHEVSRHEMRERGTRNAREQREHQIGVCERGTRRGHAFRFHDHSIGTERDIGESTRERGDEPPRRGRRLARQQPCGRENEGRGTRRGDPRPRRCGLCEIPRAAHDVVANQQSLDALLGRRRKAGDDENVADVQPGPAKLAIDGDRASGTRAYRLAVERENPLRQRARASRKNRQPCFHAACGRGDDIETDTQRAVGNAVEDNVYEHGGKTRPKVVDPATRRSPVLSASFAPMSTSHADPSADDPLDDFRRRTVTLNDETRTVYTAGRGAAVIVMAEMPGISPHVARFARWVRDAGFAVYMPSLFGRDGAYPHAQAGLAVLKRACVSAEFRALDANVSSPVTRWLRALARLAHGECGGPGVGAIGMCFTGNFALSMMLEPSMIAPVLCQPSLPLSAPDAIHIAPDEVASVRSRLERENLTVRGYRFDGDRHCTAERFEAYARVLGERFEATVIPSSAAHPKPPPFFEQIVGGAHSVVTAHLVDAAGEPTRAARDEILRFFTERLRGGHRAE